MCSTPIFTLSSNTVEGTTESEMEGMQGEREGTTDSKTKDYGSNSERVIFVLNNLPIHYQPGEPVQLMQFRITNLAATYIMPLGQILSSTLNTSGFVSKIYVNFGAMGCCEFNPRARLSTQTTQFITQLEQLFQAGVLYNPEDGQIACRLIPNLQSLVSTLPTNCRKIGCVHGPFSLTMTPIMDLRDYLRSCSSTEQTLVFVVGDTDTEIHQYIDDFVQVCGFEYVTTHGLARVISSMETRFGLV